MHQSFRIFLPVLLCLALLAKAQADETTPQGNLRTISDALTAALAELEGTTTPADLRLQYLDATYVGDRRRWDFDFRDGPTIYIVRVESTGEIRSRSRQDERGGDPVFWAQVAPVQSLSGLDDLVVDATERVRATGEVLAGPLIIQYRQRDARGSDTPRPPEMKVFVALDDAEMARVAVYTDGDFERLQNARLLEIDLPDATPPTVDPPTATAPTVDVPVIDIPEIDPPAVDVPQITIPEIDVLEDEDVAIIRLSGDILFDFDKFDIRPDAAQALSQILLVMADRYADAPFTIHGHTDAKGSDAYNLTLSQARAESVRAWFVANGVPVDRMSVVGHGEARPVAANTNPDGSDNPEGRQLNRRVELVFSLSGRAESN